MNAYADLYMYATGEREDGMRYAIGGRLQAGGLNGAVALFAERADAVLFGNTMRERHGIPFLALPSAG